MEEIIFRGALLSIVEKEWGRRQAIILQAIVFMLGHISGIDLFSVSFFLVVIAGVLVAIMFAMITIESGSILNSIWNFFMVTVNRV